MARDLFWSVFRELHGKWPEFGFSGRRYCGIPRRFKRTINVVDSTTLQLVANCLDWAKHRRRKAAARMHLRLDLQSFLPSFVLVRSAGTNDLAESYEVCAGVKAGEIVVFDKAYVGYEHLHKLTQRGVFFKEMKQTLQVADFMGHSENAVRRQIWTALLVYVLLRFVAWQSHWKHSFTRLFTLLRGVLWSNAALSSVLARCGTAPGRARARAAPAQLLLPGLSPGSKKCGKGILKNSHC